MVDVDLKEKAHQAREERARDLKGLFDSCFVPRPPKATEDLPQEESLIHTENSTPEISIYSENSTSENRTYTESSAPKIETYAENSTSEIRTYMGNSTLRNSAYTEKNTPEIRTYVKNSTPEIRTHPENSTPNGDTFSLLKMIGCTAFGVLSALKNVFPSGNGMMNIVQFAQSSGISRSAFIAQLRILEQRDLIRFGPPERRGRRIEILCLLDKDIYPENRIYPENNIPLCSSSYLNNIKQQLQNKYTENSTSDFPMDDLALIGPLNMATLSPAKEELAKLPPLPAWEKARMVAQAEELFYVGMAAKVDIDTFSRQTVNLYERISKERGREYTAALFLILLPKAKDNPTGYISSAVKQGAEPTAGSIIKVREIWELLDALSKAPTSEEIRHRIKEAAESDDPETLTTLAQQQTQVKMALRMLSWDGTAETLIERRDAFVSSLLGN